MRDKRKYLTFLFFFILTACSNENTHEIANSKDKTADSSSFKSSIDKQVQKSIKLDNDFEIKVGQKEDFDTFETYTLFILTHKKKKLYIDTTGIEYEFSDKLYPIVRQLENKIFEILVEINDRPNKNYLKYFKIHHDKVVSTGKLPTFVSSVSNLDIDNYLEAAGYWYYGEIWGDDDKQMTAYNPIIYYEFRPSGIILDSALTISKNKEIYGDFHGFNYDDGPAVMVSDNGKWDDEIERIKRIK